MYEHTHIGLDVHKDSIAVAVLRPGTTKYQRVCASTPRRTSPGTERHPS